MPGDVEDVLAAEELARQQGEDDDGDEQQEGQHAEPHEQQPEPVERAAGCRSARARVLRGHQAASRSKKWPSTRSWVISLPLISARSWLRYMT